MPTRPSVRNREIGCLSHRSLMGKSFRCDREWKTMAKAPISLLIIISSLHKWLLLQRSLIKDISQQSLFSDSLEGRVWKKRTERERRGHAFASANCFSNGKNSVFPFSPSFFLPFLLLTLFTDWELSSFHFCCMELPSSVEGEACFGQKDHYSLARPACLSFNFSLLWAGLSKWVSGSFQPKQGSERFMPCLIINYELDGQGINCLKQALWSGEQVSLWSALCLRVAQELFTSGTGNPYKRSG